MIKQILKITLSILSLIVIIPGSKLGFPVAILLLLKATEGALGMLFSISFLGCVVYLIISGWKKYNSLQDDFISLIILLGLNVLLFTHISNILNYGDNVVYILAASYFIGSFILILICLFELNKKEGIGKV